MNVLKTIGQTWMILILIAGIAAQARAEAEDKGEQLRRTMAEIALLNSQIAQRRADAMAIRDALSERLDAIRSEAARMAREKQIHAPEEALNQPRIFYDLMLMSEIAAYIDRYSQKIAYYRVAGDRLSYLYQQADDDLKIVSTLSDMKIDALIAQVETIIADYLPDAQTLIIQPGSLAPKPPEAAFSQLKAAK